MGRDRFSQRLEQSVTHLLHRAGQCATELFQAEVSLGDLTPRQYVLLLAVAQNEGMSQTQLVKMTGIDRSTMTEIVGRLLKKRLLQRHRMKSDVRVYEVKLTDEGFAVLRLAEPLTQQVDARILEALPGQQGKRFIQDLNTIVKSLVLRDSKVEPE